jgi:predicted nuclease of restriction endonuclease-like (RecB) superfamily
MNTDLAFYGTLLADIKIRIRHAQNRAALAVNAELVRLYWDIGRLILARQQQEGWGAGVIPRLARDLHNELPEVKGFSDRNIKRMVQFAREYTGLFSIGPRAVAQLGDVPQDPKKGPLPVAQSDASETEKSNLQHAVASLPWAHNVLLIQMVKDLPRRLWYAEQDIAQGWSRDTLAAMIKRRAHTSQGAAVTNFAARLRDPHAKLAGQLLKDPYVFDFLTLEEPFHERELETGLVRHLEMFLLELGQGFAFVGRQYALTVGEDDFYIDLLFYHLRLRAFIVVELKRGPFKPEYAGKMNFYCSVVDDKLRHKNDQPTIGLILCQTKDRLIAEYTLRDVHKPIGVADYELTRALPKELASSLPSIEQIEAELQSEVKGRSKK